MSDGGGPRGDEAWSEPDSDLYRSIAPVAVPARADQLAVIASLLPFGPGDRFNVVDVGSGEGALAATILECFPEASIVALDGSPSMRALAAATLADLGARAEVHDFELASHEWLPMLEGADCLVSSLCLHHLSSAQKKTLFENAAQRLSDAGAIVIGDLVEPQRSEPAALFAETWDRAAALRSLEVTASLDLFDRFVRSQWNYYRWPDPVDHPSPLLDQLLWLIAAGFRDVDCFWLQAGHAVYGGYKGPAGDHETVPFERALRSAEAVLARVENVAPSP